MAKYMDSENFKHFWNNILKPNLLKKVDKVSGKGLSTNDFTDTYKNAIGSLQDSVGALNTTKVDKVIGKDLSTNDFTNEYKDLIIANKDAISKLKGFIYPCTAQALEEMSQEQQAELHTQGYRAIKTENNGTVVLLGLASDGSLEWLGCNQPCGNLLENPDFAIAQAGYGGMHGTKRFAADRWQAEDNILKISSNEQIIEFKNDGESVSIVIQPHPIDALTGVLGKHITLAICLANNEVHCQSDLLPQKMPESTATFAGIDLDFVRVGVALFPSVMSYQFARIQIPAQKTVSIKWIRLLRGSYTLKTLPPWKKPDFSTELIKCLRYFQLVEKGSICGLIAGVAGNMFISVYDFPVEMRITPTVTPTIGSVAQFDVFSFGAYPGKYAIINGTTGNIQFIVGEFDAACVGKYAYNISGIQLSADL